MPHGVRRRRLERQLHRAGNPSIYSNRNDHGAKRCRSYQASIRSPKHNQQFHPSSYRPADRACRRHGDDRRDDDARRRLKSQHGSSVVTFRPGLQFRNLRHANCRHYTRIRRNSHRGYGNLHGPNHPAESGQRHGDRNTSSRSHKKSPSNDGRPGRSERQPNPATDTLAANRRVTLTAQVFGTTNTGVSWSVGGISDRNTMLGQICAVGSSPCQSVTSGSALQVDYLAPGTIPQPNPVSVVATSAADATKSAAAQITVINHVLVSVQPASITLAPLAVEGFTATVLGTSNQSVVWQIQGTACANSSVCGAIDANGNYTAPGSAPTPDALQVVAVSSDDTTQSGAANVTISTGANILSLHPASVYAGAADGFTLLVEGSGFTSSSPGPGSILMIAGTARTTTCLASTECSAPVAAADVSVAANLSVQIQNPGGTASNAVSLVVAPPNTSNDVIALSSASPNATGKDIVVVDPTTAGVSAQGNDVDLNVAALGMFSLASNSCSLSCNPLPLLRPASGSATFNICVFSESGLDTSMTFTVTGRGDVAVIAKQPAGLGIIQLTLQVPSSALPGARTLFIQNTNLDETAASGALVIQ